jgi:hypothetical protein
MSALPSIGVTRKTIVARGNPNFAEGELLGEILSKNIHVFNENIKGNLCCAWRNSIKWKVGLSKCGVQRDK